MTILAEELLILVLDDRGVASTMADLNTGAVGAILLDLALEERIDLVDGKVVVTDPSPVGHPVLDDVLTQMASDRPRSAKSWHNKIYWRQSQKVLDAMVERDLLRQDKRRFLGVIPTTRYPATDLSRRSAIQLRLAKAVAAGRADQPRTGALAGLLHALDLSRRALPERSGTEARKALKTIAENSWAGDSTRKALSATQTAVMTAVMTTVITGSVIATGE